MQGILIVIGMTLIAGAFKKWGSKEWYMLWVGSVMVILGIIEQTLRLL